MALMLPEPVAHFFTAENSGDIEALGRCFTADATVGDEGRTHQGIVAIKQWMAEAKKKYHHTAEPLNAVERDGKLVVTAQVSGSFPNSPLAIQHVFGLAVDKIRSLQIG